MSTAIRWRTAYWWRVTPGKTGFAGLAAFPLLFLLPLESLGLFPGWDQASRVLVWMGAFGLAGALGRDAARPGPACLWIFQKGGRISDHMTQRALLDAGLALVVLGWWVAAWTLVAHLGVRASPAGAGSLGLLAATTFLLAYACLFPMAAAGLNRGTDLLLLLTLVSWLQPLLLQPVPAGLRRIVAIVLPPFGGARDAARYLAAGAWPDSAAALLHVLVYGSACVATGMLILGRWRPGR